MQCIYALFWEQNNMIYIGKTVSLKRRVAEHLEILNANSHYNSKLQNQYNEYGEPSIIELEYCEDEDVYIKENYWIKEYDSVLSGLNIYGGRGEE